MKQPTEKHTYSTLIIDLASLIEQGRKTAVRYVNTALVAAYWLVGRRIVEHEQKGKERADYGKSLLKKISIDLTPRFGKGFTERNLEHMRQFYFACPEISHTLCSKSSEDSSIKKSHTACAELSPISETLSWKFPLSWSHYRLLMRLDEPFKCEFYEAEYIRGNWSVRQLDRQIQVEYTLGGMNNKAFASKYRLKLPDPKLLKREIEHERQRLVEMKIYRRKE